MGLEELFIEPSYKTRIPCGVLTSAMADVLEILIERTRWSAESPTPGISTQDLDGRSMRGLYCHGLIERVGFQRVKLTKAAYIALTLYFANGE